MSQKSTNKSILSYFRPAAPEAPPGPSVPSTPKRPSQISPAIPKSATPHPPSSPLSYKATPVAIKPSRLEIGASDDEGSDDGFSDGSLEDLSTLLGRERPGNAASSSRNLFTTPRAKRTAVEFYSSPLAIIPKHKFDLKALAKDARRDDATNASSLRVKAAADAAREESSPLQGEAFGVAFADLVKEKTGQDAQKVLRAVQRTETVLSEPRYCFFDRDYRVPPSSPTPKLPNNSPWKLLTQGNSTAKERNLTSGVPQTILQKTGGLPDSIFLWVLDELCIQKSILVRQEYCNIVSDCPDHVERLITPQLLEDLFIRLGAADELRDWKPELTISKPSHEPYQERDWSCLESFLVLLTMISGHLSIASAIYASQVLLRMSMDKLLLCNIDLLTAYEDAMRSFTNAIPRSSWDSFCFETCSLLHVNIKHQCIRASALLCLPVCDPGTHDLRRRLAVTFLFDDPGLSRHHPDEVVTIRGVIGRLGGNDFSVSPQTNFTELKAMIILLDIAVDDGSKTVFDSPEDEKKFNGDVDELASKLREIWRKTNDTGMKLARTEAKSVVEWVQKRLSHSVRTRREIKKSIYDLPGQSEDPFLPRQQDYMAKFLQKMPKPGRVDESCITVKTS